MLDTQDAEGQVPGGGGRTRCRRPGEPGEVQTGEQAGVNSGWRQQSTDWPAPLRQTEGPKSILGLTLGSFLPSPGKDRGCPDCDGNSSGQGEEEGGAWAEDLSQCSGAGGHHLERSGLGDGLFSDGIFSQQSD